MLLVNDECQRSTVSGITNIGSNSISSTNSNPLAMYSRNGNSYVGQQNNKFKKNFDVVYEFCRCKGHSIDQCYKWIGYPTDFYIKKKVYNDGVWHVMR